MKQIFSRCYNLELEEGRIKLYINRYDRTKGIISTDLRMIAQQFTEQNRGRMFAFFRHPYYIYLAEKSVSSAMDNPLARQILNQPEGNITLRGLGTAKKVIREKCVVGLLDSHINESIERIGEYYGWGKFKINCARKYVNQIKKDADGELMDGNTKSWNEFLKNNYVDLQLYEFARSVFRAHRQTIIPREKQMSSTEEQEEESE